MVLPAFVFLPLYMYPYNSTSWSTLTTSIVANPELKFHVIVAPNLAFTDPDVNYVAGLTNLSSYANVLTLGYVYTSYGNRDVIEIEAEIDKFVGWNSPTELPIGGIFFDESPSNNSTFSYMSTLTTYAKTSLGAGKDYIYFNPGVAVDASFYTLADSINIFEESYANFNETLLTSLDNSLLAKSTYAIHDFTGTTTEQTALVSQLASANLAGMLITTQTGYTEWSSLWSSFCSEVNTLNLGNGTGGGGGGGGGGHGGGGSGGGGGNNGSHGGGGGGVNNGGHGSGGNNGGHGGGGGGGYGGDDDDECDDDDEDDDDEDDEDEED
ncbi:putative spherulin 4-like cell surface protein [Botrytis fragariae]|uniref:Putative spherulin 4-like cell surface protein n=1 Tax=Botrytis fragariae TaxID=1964551 RepID=A0A8H6ENF1_9HELO|nr:putative spherulin 4-like cell surface protein [Botrytis fragariae]KAF5878295.1 putative spherulin 4-like cell surface protein [Botrytis fragariae]